MKSPFSTPQTKAERIIQAAFLALALGMLLQQYLHPLLAFLSAIVVVVVLHFILQIVFSKTFKAPHA